MTKQETAMIIASLVAAYPIFLKDKSKEEVSLAVNTWYEVLTDYTYQQMSAAVKIEILSNTSGFPPSIGQLVEKINIVERTTKEELNELTAWAIVRKALSNSLYNSEEEFNKFPEIIKKCIKDPRTLREWAQLDISEIETVIQSNLMRTFRAELKKEKERESIPQQLRELIGGNNDSTRGIIESK